MKSRIIGSLVVVMMLVAVTAVPAMAVEDTVPASVTVTAYINFTVTDNGAAGLQFGSLNPGISDTQEVAQNGVGAVTLGVGNETNVDVDIFLKGDDFLDGAKTLAVTNVKYDDDTTLSEGLETDLAEGTMATTYGSAWTTVTAGTGATIEVYHWITIPSDQEAGGYASDFYYKAE